MGSNADMSLVKLANYRCVWDYIHSHGEMTIPQISKATGLSLPTVTRAIEYSLEEGVVQSVGIVGGERGRKAIVYALAPDYMHFIFISVHGQRLHYEVHNFLSSVIKSGTYDVDDSNIFSVLNNIIKNCIENDSFIKFIAVAFSGAVFEGRIIESLDFPSLSNFPLKAYLEEEYSLTAIVENDLHCAAAAASKYAPQYEKGTTVAFYFGDEGYGSGILINGEILRGASGSAGELHNVATEHKSERSPLTYAEILRTVCAVLNPDRVILYPNGGIDIEKVKTIAFENVSLREIPELIENLNFTKDTFFGLVALCKEKLIEPYAKVRVLKLEVT